MNNQLLYSFICSTNIHDTQHHRIIPTEGIKLIATLAHKHDIPITWVVESQHLQDIKDIINQGHLQYGDEIILMIDLSAVLEGIVVTSKAEEIVVLRQRLPEYILSEQKKVKQIFPWTEANLIGADQKSPALIQVLEELDCIGLWGYRWEDNEITGDRGCPWSFFYAYRDHYNIPAPYVGRTIAIERSSLDLNATYYSGNSNVFSASPSSLEISGLLKENNVYATNLINEYLRNLPWNRFLIFIQQQPAIDLEYASYDVYNKGTISRIAGIIENYFGEVESNINIKAVSLPEAIRIYGNQFESTEACCMIFDNIIPGNAEINFHIPPIPKQKPPYPLTFFYYDRECQIVFKEGQMIPIEIKNYGQPPFESKYYIEKDIPVISSFRPSRDRDKLIMEFEIESMKSIPYGLAIWDDHSIFRLVSTNARFVKWIGSQLIFLRIDLKEGLNQIEISLAI